MAKLYPTKIHSYNAYNNASGSNKVVGISDEITLPELSALTETLSGAGILGEIDEPVMGHFGSTEMEIPFKTLSEEMFEMWQTGGKVDLTLRASQQSYDPSDYSIDYLPTRIVVKGLNKGMTGGSLKQGQGTASSLTVEVLYLLIEVNGVKVLELDKLNYVFKVNNVDMLSKIRSQV